MKPLWQIADFVRQIRRKLRFGELSRGRLELLRLEIRWDEAECDWIVRPADVWDESLPQQQRERNVSEQALRDALRVRDLLFDSLPKVESAFLRSFRPSRGREPPELIIAGVAKRDTPPLPRVSSLVMRAKLCGFHFEVEDGILQALRDNEQAVLQAIGDVHFQERNPLRGGGVLVYGSE